MACVNYACEFNSLCAGNNPACNEEIIALEERDVLYRDMQHFVVANDTEAELQSVEDFEATFGHLY